jgi:hypothetical protein
MERDNDAVRRDFAGEGRVREAGSFPEHAGHDPAGPVGAAGDDPDRPDVRRDPWAIRAEDTEPYVALQYVARLFKIVAMVVVVALTAEIVAGVALEGADALLPLTFDVIRGIVLAAILWGAGDLTLLLIDVGHDVRAARVLLGRLTARSAGDYVDRRERQQDGPPV